MINCNVYRDLILLYVSGECGEDTRTLVQSHMEQCKECRAYYEGLAEPIGIEGTGRAEGATGRSEAAVSMAKAADGEITEAKEDHGEKIVHKVTRRLKRKWVMSLVAGAASLFLATGIGILIFNQVRGEGICFTSLDERYYTASFLRAVQKGNYEKAFSLLDIENQYNQITNADLDTSTDIFKYSKVVIGEKEYYISPETAGGEYRDYLEDQDEAEFWGSMMVRNSEGREPVAIPEHMFEEAAIYFKQVTGAAAVKDPADAGDYITFLYTKEMSASGDEFYLPDNASIDAVTLQEACIPAKMYEEGYAEWQSRQEIMEACADFYKEMGYVSYRELMKKNFMNQMEKMEAGGLVINKISVSDSYRLVQDSGQVWWQVEVNVKTGGEGRGKVIIMANGDMLHVSGGSDAGGEVDKLLDYIRVSDDPAGFYKRLYD